MTDYPQYPTDPNNPPGPAYGGAPTRGPRPAAVSTAVKLIWANIALGIISALVTFVMLDSIIDEQLDAAGVSENISADTVRSTAIVAAIFGLVISVGLYALMAFFISRGANWARIVYTVLAALSVLGGVFGLGSQPLLLMVLSLVSLLLTIAAVVLLFKSESSAWFKAH
jgi:hypothetical protein